MALAELLSEQEIQALRQGSYNAELVDVIEVHEDLRILRVRPDGEPPTFSPGQYTTLGLGNWEPRIDDVAADEQLDETQVRKLLRRAYSFSCPLCDESGELAPPSRVDFLEFYIVLVRFREERPPGLTPRLFAMEPGSRLFLGRKVTGHYTLDGVQPDDNLVFVATGTGEAPHNAMIAELLARGHRGRLTAVTCVRQRRDLGYLATYRELERRFPQLTYIALTTREPENLDPSAKGFQGRRHLQDYVRSGEFERDAGIALAPENTHVFLCGNPAMIGAPETQGATPQPGGMVELLMSRGFDMDQPSSPGRIHFEKYW